MSSKTRSPTMAPSTGAAVESMKAMAVSIEGRL